MPSPSTPAGAVAVADTEGLSGPDLLNLALERSGFWHRVADVGSWADDPSALRVVIKPDLSAFAAGSPSATDPALVEALIDALVARRYTNVAVVAGRDSSALWAENRDVNVIADLIGYRFTTPNGHDYDITDLTCDTPPPPPAAGTLLAPEEIGAAWREADIRIVFAKNKTDDAAGYALCLESLVDVLALEDKDYFYRHRCDRAAVVSEILRQAPPHAAIIDAVISGHGSGGARRPRALATGTVIAASSAVLADYVGALKMGLDPAVSPVMQRLFQESGVPAGYDLDGSLARYAAWINPHPILLDSTRRREQWVGVSRTVAPWLQETDTAVFPLKRLLDVKANAVIAPLLAGADVDPAAFWRLVGVNYLVDAIAGAVHAYQVLFDKDAVRRRHAPLNVDVDGVSLAEYESCAAELRDLSALLEPLVADRGLRWRYLDGAVIFEASTDYPIAFDEFVAAVDVTRTIQYMNDYIGGEAEPRARDAAGRVTHQVERNIYLPQPNYVVLYQGDVIDVTKLEFAEYSPDRQRMHWKTIKSENASARFDDGMVTFDRVADGTRVSICGRQQFTLPPALEMAQLDLNPEWKSHLVTDAYVTFFSRTFANLEAVAEGRDVRVGLAWREPSDAEGSEPLPAVRIEAAVMTLLEKLAAVTNGPGAGSTPAADFVDANGFAHFRPPAAGPHAAGPRATAHAAGLPAAAHAAGLPATVHAAGLPATAQAGVPPHASDAPGTSPLADAIRRYMSVWSDLADAMVRDGRAAGGASGG